MPVENKVRACRRFEKQVNEVEQNFLNSPLHNLCDWSTFAQLNIMEMKSIQSLLKDMVKMKQKQLELALDNVICQKEVPITDKKVVLVLINEDKLVLLPTQTNTTNMKEKEKQKENKTFTEVIIEKTVPISDKKVVLVPITDKKVVPKEEDEDSEDDEDEEYKAYIAIKHKQNIGINGTTAELEIYLKHHTRDDMPLTDADKTFLCGLQGFT
jgi:hypothetical protein